MALVETTRRATQPGAEPSVAPVNHRKPLGILAIGILLIGAGMVYLCAIRAGAPAAPEKHRVTGASMVSSHGIGR